MILYILSVLKWGAYNILTGVLKVNNKSEGVLMICRNSLRLEI